MKITFTRWCVDEKGRTPSVCCNREGRTGGQNPGRPKMKALLTTAAVLASLAGTAHSADTSKLTGTMWKDYCTIDKLPPNSKEERETSCLLYLMGLRDGFDLWRISGQQAPACIPPQATGIQLKDVVMKYWRNNPAHRHEYMGLFITRAFAEAWPCDRDEEKS